jgi:L-fuconolactonase
MRHVLHDEADDNYMLRDDFNAGVAQLHRFGLRYDILIFEKHLPQTIQFIDRHPNQIFIIDHIAKPKIAAGEIEPWLTGMKDVARRQNVYCKLSGMVTEAAWSGWTETGLQPYTDAVLAAFGPKRVMFGSDWPVLSLAAPYTRWVNVVKKAIASLSAEEQQRILAGTAIEAYGL